VLVAGGALAAIVAMRRLVPKWPSFLIALAAAAVIVSLLRLPVETIGSRFGALASMLPAPHLPAAGFATIRDLVPSAFTIFVLGGIESLLSAVVADGMTGRRHRSNMELVAQGIANLASACMGGIPATGAIARTATNIRSGARTPIAGMIHALGVLAMMALLAPLAAYIPLSALGAVLVIVCWNMAEFDSFRRILGGPAGDRVVLVLTFALTVLVDLSFAIGVGMVLASFLFVHRMAGVVERQLHGSLLPGDGAETPNDRDALPPGVEIFRLNGPFFFGAAAAFEEALARAGGRPRVLILAMDAVPLIDASGAAILDKFVRSAKARGTRIILSGARDDVAEALSGIDAPRTITLAEALSIAH
jgi:SulP family sulfate permease